MLQAHSRKSERNYFNPCWKDYFYYINVKSNSLSFCARSGILTFKAAIKIEISMDVLLFSQSHVQATFSECLQLP
jgi:hypothetical protein